MPEATCDIGLIGLAVMGQNLVLNMNDHGYKVAVFNRTVSKVDDFINDEAKGTQVVGAHSIEELAALLKRPRRVMLMVKAGATVDDMIGQLVPHLEAGDIIVTGTPSGVGLGRKPPLWMKPGDVVEVEIERIGVLRNSIVDEG